jgi:hypothetical protein
MLQTLCEFLFALLILIGSAAGLFLATFAVMAILLFVMSIPVVLCHRAYEWIKDFVNRP